MKGTRIDPRNEEVRAKERKKEKGMEVEEERGGERIQRKMRW
jgi:hypothetical protein